MFLGEYKTTFSGAGRVILPRKMRDQLKGQNQVILSRGYDNCIWGFDLKQWQEQAEKQLESSIVEREGRDIRRYLFSGALEADVDAQGRFVIPVALLRYANLSTEVMIIGAGDHFEIWNPIDWQKLINRLEERKA